MSTPKLECTKKIVGIGTTTIYATYDKNKKKNSSKKVKAQSETASNNMHQKEDH